MFKMQYYYLIVIELCQVMKFLFISLIKMESYKKMRISSLYYLMLYFYYNYKKSYL